MSRLRITLMSAAMMVALAALTLNSLAQPPGRNGGGPGGGPGGFSAWRPRRAWWSRRSWRLAALVGFQPGSPRGYEGQGQTESSNQDSQR